jgi:hypothetical protein
MQNKTDDGDIICKSCFVDNIFPMVCYEAVNNDILKYNNSNVFNTDFNFDIRFYELFTRGTLFETQDKNKLLDKQIVIIKEQDLRPEKDYSIKQTLIGFCSYVTESEYILNDGYIIDIVNNNIYALFPKIRQYKFEPTDVMYYVE